MTHKDLFLTCYVFSSDDDYDVVEDISVGYDTSFNLIVLLEYTDYGNHANDCCTYAVVTKDESFKLSSRLNIGMTNLPHRIGTWADGYADLVNPTLGETRHCFADILTKLPAEVCKFRLVRTQGKSGYTFY